jgi:hypothetical protein
MNLKKEIYGSYIKNIFSVTLANHQPKMKVMEMDFGLGCQVFHFATKSDSSQNRGKRPDCRRS